MNLKRLNYALLTMVFAALLLFVGAKAQDTTVIPLPTMSQIRPPFSVFPADLYCEYSGDIAKGPTWGDITIGVSKVDDLKRYMAGIYDYEVREYADYIQIFKNGRLSENDGIPEVHACLDTDTHIVKALEVLPHRLMVIQDLISKYGIPDVVTWGFSHTDRTAIWFGKGIAVSASILQEDSITNYGHIYVITYFPFQSRNGFEKRWPYNQTASENPPEGDYIHQPTPSQEQNPFGFQSMVATITAEPSRTPTPTFAPYTPAPTATSKGL